jgi:hypothetical protein
MKLVLQLAERLRGNGNQRIVADAVRRCAAELVRGLNMEVHVLPPAQRAGYVRAHARAIVSREARKDGVLQPFAEQVLDGVVARVLDELSTAPPMPLRRAA